MAASTSSNSVAIPISLLSRSLAVGPLKKVTPQETSRYFIGLKVYYLATYLTSLSRNTVEAKSNLLRPFYISIPENSSYHSAHIDFYICANLPSSHPLPVFECKNYTQRCSLAISYRHFQAQYGSNIYFYLYQLRSQRDDNNNCHREPTL